jgi:hypothetical protein
VLIVASGYTAASVPYYAAPRSVKVLSSNCVTIVVYPVTLHVAKSYFLAMTCTTIGQLPARLDGAHTTVIEERSPLVRRMS